MKRIIIAIALVIGFQNADAQTDTVPAYKKFKVIPVFTIMSAPDSIKFTKNDLAKKKATVVMLFNPDCDHCQHATKDLIEHIDLFKDAQIIMVSSMNFSHIKKFYQDYKIADHPNITMGRDGAYFLGTYYKIKNYPSIFVYDKKGGFVQEFRGTADMQLVAGSL